MSTAVLTLQAELEYTRIQQEKRRRLGVGRGEPVHSTWNPVVRYVNRETGREYKPHHQAEYDFVYEDTPRNNLAKGGEGGGKSVAGIIKDLERLRRGMDGIIASPDFEHFKKSLWVEFARWCPWDEVVEREQYRGAREWTPSQAFMLHFKNGAVAYCGGMDDPESWEGGNISFAHLDEARRKRDAKALKVLAGRVRIAGKNGEPPQLWLTSTPRKHWMYEYFGGVEGTELVDVDPDDPFLSFKQDARVISLFTADNAENLAEGYVEQRRQSLTESEARVLLEAAWEDIDEADRFLPSMVMWDNCKEEIPPLDPHTPLVLIIDAGVSNDNFGLLAMSRHPNPARYDSDVAVRYVEKFVPPKKGTLNFAEPEKRIRWLCDNYNVIALVYDPYQLHDMATRLQNDGVVWVIPFNQGRERLEADKQLLDLITNRRIVHDGNIDLREHIDNANAKPDPESRKIRMVKRYDNKKIDLAVCASMGAYKCLELPL